MSAPSAWLSLTDAIAYLGLSAADFIDLIQDQRIALWVSPGGDALRFRCADLDALFRQCAPDEALGLLSRVMPFEAPSPSHPTPERETMPTSPDAGSQPNHIPAKQAALALHLSYKTLLRLIREGVVPAIDLNAGTGHSRPRFVIDADAAKQALAQQAHQQQQARQPSKAAPSVDLRRLLTITPTRGKT